MFRKLEAAVEFLPNGGITMTQEMPIPGQQLLFEGADGALTSTVVAIERPQFEVVIRYPAPLTAGG
ncbi:MAG: hypothetical protein AAGF12_08270 [Myxococcota bacterium]